MAGECLHELLHSLEPAEGGLEGQAANAEIAGHHALAGHHFEDVEDIFALPEAIEKDGHGSQVNSVASQPNQVALDARQLSQQNPYPLGAGRDFDIQQFLNREAKAQIVGERSEVIHPVCERDALRVSLVLEGLLEASVEVADVITGANNRLALEFEHHAQYPVGRGVLRPHAQDNPFLLARNSFQRDRHLAISLSGIILAQRMTFPIFRQKDSPQIRMSRELNSKEIEDFALECVGAWIDGDQGDDERILAAGPRLEPKPCCSLK